MFYASAFRATAKNIQRMLLLLLLSYTTHSDCYFNLAGFDLGTQSLHDHDVRVCLLQGFVFLREIKYLSHVEGRDNDITMF